MEHKIHFYENQKDLIIKLENKIEKLEDKLEQRRDKKEELYRKVIGEYGNKFKLLKMGQILVIIKTKRNKLKEIIIYGTMFIFSLVILGAIFTSILIMLFGGDFLETEIGNIIYWTTQIISFYLSYKITDNYKKKQEK